MRFKSKQKCRVTLSLLGKQISNVTIFFHVSNNIKMATEGTVETIFWKDICLKYLFMLVLRDYVVVIFNHVTSRNYSLLTFAGSFSLIVRSGRTEEFERCFCKIREMTIVIRRVGRLRLVWLRIRKQYCGRWSLGWR